MKNCFKKYLSGREWLLIVDKWDKKLQNERETQFALGNGAMGSRGILEEVPYDSRVGTYLAGVYDKMGSQVAELVNLPNPFNFKINYGGEKLDVIAMDVLEHNQLLDMHHGLFYRNTTYITSYKKRFEYQSLRFISMIDKNVGALKVYFTPLDDTAKISVQTSIDTSVSNTGAITEGRKQHFSIMEVSKTDVGDYVCVSTLDKKHLISYGSTWYYQLGGKNHPIDDTTLEIVVKKNQTICFTKIFTIHHSLDRNFVSIKRESLQIHKASVKLGFENLITRHISEYSKLWAQCDIRIDGDSQMQKAIRFNIYHMLICGSRGYGQSSIGARTLSGEGYHGHIFWDSEIFLMPFFIYNFPYIAKNLLLYRFNRLEKAKDIAKQLKYKGAMFPWESADTGEEETPTWAKDIDGTIVRIRTNEMEHHITADVAYSFYLYHHISGDDEFMINYGFEVLLQTASFWISRVTYNKRKKYYEIKNVMGPDEFHEGVNNNVYTNMLAKLNIFNAGRLCVYFKKKFPRELKNVLTKCKLTENEIMGWKKIASKIYIPVDRKTSIIEQFEGFFKKKKVRISEFDKNFMPMFPKSVNMRRLGDYRIVKQADVVMLMFLLADLFSNRVKKKNYEYYLKLTLHKSSLSPSMYSAMGAIVGDSVNALHYFWVSANADLKNLHGNTSDGAHAASLGGTWQAAVFGFAGVKLSRDVLCVDPRLPEHFKSMKFSLVIRGHKIKISVNHNKVILFLDSKEKNACMLVRVFGKASRMCPNKNYTFIRR